MMLKYGMAIAFLLAAASPALADQCGDAPLAPAMPSVSDIGKQAPAAAAASKHNAFLDIKNWQGSLKGYRDCLNAEKAKDQAAVASAQQSGDKDAQSKIDKLQQDMQADDTAYNQSVTTETQIVNEFVAMSNAYCSRTDVDKASCPKK